MNNERTSFPLEKWSGQFGRHGYVDTRSRKEKPRKLWEELIAV
jgi:hypothetical protein